MKKIFKAGIVSVFLTVLSLATLAQASLTIENNSLRIMTVKVMSGNNGKGILHEKVIIDSYSSQTIYFSESGHYFTKTKAVLTGKDPIYQKGKPFQVTNDKSGYSVMTLTFSIKESLVPQVSGGKQISKQEFEQD